ncbi:formylglycine-generating enzyme family protein [Desulfobacterales bacterium HSG17]|nr:formylglycine-generating enzyme family protein [Desulfobacterales bacterium HSG17]
MVSESERSGLIQKFIQSLPQFLDELRLSGFKIGVREYLNVQKLLVKMAEAGQLPDNLQKGNLHKLRPFIASIVCSNAGEQKEFGLRFEIWITRFYSGQGDFSEKFKPEKPEKTDVEKVRSKAWYWIPVFLILLAVCVYFFPDVFVHEPVVKVFQENNQILQPGIPGTFLLWLSGLALLGVLIRELWMRYLVSRAFLTRVSVSEPVESLKFYVLGKSPELFNSIGFLKAAQAFRRHVQKPDSAIDVEASVEKTIRNGGFFTPVSGLRQITPEYLVLIDRTSFQDHQARWIDAMVNRLAENDVFIKRYYFDGDPRSCIPQKGKIQAVNLHDLAEQYPEHRLIIFSDGAGFKDPFSGETVSWIEQFYIWEERSIMLIHADRDLSRHPLKDFDFIVMPARENNMAALIDAFNNEVINPRLSKAYAKPLPAFISHQYIRLLEQSEPKPEIITAINNLLANYIDEPGRFWLCACAVYPDINWDLTLFLGHMLKDKADREIFSKNRLMLMARLPWFRYGYMPDWFRRFLINELTGEKEQQVRQILFDLLQDHKDRLEPGYIPLEIGKQYDKLIPRMAKYLLRLAQVKSPKSRVFHDRIFVTFMQDRLSVRISRMAGNFLRGLNIGNQEEDQSIREKHSTGKGASDTGAADQVIDKLSMNFAYIKPGTFMMGSPEDEPERMADREHLHKVTLTKGFYMQTTAVTIGQWRIFADDTGYRSQAETEDGAYAWTGEDWKKNKDVYWDNLGFEQEEDHPVTCVSWNDAQVFIKWISEKDGKIYRLPTEAEWEYACRAGTDTPFSFGKCLSTDQANYDGNYPLEDCPKGTFRGKTTPAGSLEANAWGLYDMHGNVWEWCQDRFGDYTFEAIDKAVVDPVGAIEGDDRVVRGGSWGNRARDCRSAVRGRGGPGDRSDLLGFRLLRSYP